MCDPVLPKEETILHRQGAKERRDRSVVGVAVFFFFLQQILFIYFLEQFRVTAKSSRKIKVPEAEHRRVNLGFSHIPIGLLLPPKHSLPPSEWPTGYDELTLTHQSSSPQVHSLHTAGPILGDVRSVGLTSA